jgi:hypothetical protein
MSMACVYQARHRIHTSLTKTIDNAVYGFIARARAEVWHSRDWPTDPPLQ